MLYATVARSPASGQRVARFNRDAVAALPGVTHLVDLGHGVAVVGRSTAQVFAAREALRIEWSGSPPGAQVDSERDKALYLAHLRDPNRTPDVVFSRTGDAPAALRNAARTITREFVSEYCYHAQLEPMGAVAHVRADAAEVWTGTQWQTMAAMKTARISGLPAERVTVHQLMMGGGFGRRAHTEYIDDAVTLSKEVRAPVKLLLSRADDVASGRLRPLTAQRVTMGLDTDGRITALRHVVACEPVTPYMYGPQRWQASEGRDLITMRGSSLPNYAVPDQMAEHIHEMRGARVAAWRGIGCGYTKFALETMVDEIARGAGRDPLAYRIAMAANPRTRAVLERVREMSGWPNPREGRHLGVAFAEYGDSLNATVVEISLDRASGRIRVRRLWAAVDVGLPLQPDTIVAQIEGGAIFGVSGALKEELTIRDGAVVQRNFDDYQILRADESPEIQVAILRGSDTPTEVGELGLPPVAPAIANAVLAATGKALNHLPMTPGRVRAALAG
jgi:isoquinoline 1-oxidoreductase beta subunit